MRSIACLLAIASLSFTAQADDVGDHRISAEPIKRTAPMYPRSELRKGRQGWVDLNFVVTEDGRVVEPVVEASSGSAAFEREALKTVLDWSYKPATLNGEAIQQCKTRTRISFALEGAQGEVSRPFHTKYRRMDKAVKDGEIEKASEMLDALLQSDGLTLGENAWLWAMKARIAAVTGDKEVQLTAVRRASWGSGTWIPDTLKEGLLKSRIALEVEKGNYAASLEAYERLQSIEGTDTSRIDPVIEQIRALADSDRLYYKEASIGQVASCETCETQWLYKPLRRAIEIADVEGELGNIELRCDWQRYTDEARPGVTWEIPDSWGNCSVVVYGEPGSTFKLFEIPQA